MREPVPGPRCVPEHCDGKRKRQARQNCIDDVELFHDVQEFTHLQAFGRQRVVQVLSGIPWGYEHCSFAWLHLQGCVFLAMLSQKSG